MGFIRFSEGIYSSALILILFWPSNLHGDVLVSTIAGTNSAGYIDSPQPSEVRFNSPNGLEYWVGDRIAVSDAYNHAIRLVDLSGSTVTYAGTDVNGYLDGPPAQARFNYPLGLNLNSTSDLIVADTENDVIRRIELFGSRNVSTLAGSGIRGYLDGPALQAQFNFPNDLVADIDNNIFVTEFNNNVIRRISKDGFVTTFAGNAQPGLRNGNGTAAQFNKPAGITIDRQQNLYITEWGNHSIRKITPEGVVTTFAGGNGPGFLDGAGPAAKFNTPDGIAIDNQGTLYVVEQLNHAVRKIDPNGNTTTIAGLGVPGFQDGNASQAMFNSPSGIMWHPNGSLVVADTGNHSIRRITFTPSTNVEPSAFWRSLPGLQNSVHQVTTADSNIFALTKGKAVYASSDQGNTWRTLLNTNLSLSEGASMALDGSGLLVSGKNLIWASANAGVNWVPMIVQGASSMIHWGSLSVFGNRYFVIGTSLYVSSDRGTSWTRSATFAPRSSDNGLGPVAAASWLVRGKSGYFGASTAGGESTFQKSYDSFNGLLWSNPSEKGLRNPSTQQLPLISALFHTGNLLLIGSRIGEVFASSDEGESFSLRTNGLPKNQISAFENYGSTVFCATTNGGIFISTNNLGNWLPFDTGMKTRSVFSLHRRANLLYAGTDQGVWIRAINEIPNSSTPNPSITIHSAIELEFPSELTFTYQLQSSENLVTWRNVGDPYQGTGQKIFRLESARLTQDRYYRLRVVPK